MTISLNRKYSDDSIAVFIGAVVFVISLFVSGYYVLGDQYGYHEAYRLVKGLSFVDARRMYETKITSTEYVHFIVCWVSSSFCVDKNLLMSLVNGILAMYTFKLFRYWGGSPIVSAVFVVSNFYYFVLYFAAERLKFSFLFLVFSLFYVGYCYKFILAALLAFCSHVSIVIIYIAIWSRGLLEIDCKRLRSPGFIAVVTPVLCLLLYVAYDFGYLIHKLGGYFNSGGNFTATQLMPVVLLLIIAVFIKKNFAEPVLMFLPVLVAVSIVGGSRINMFGYMIFTYFALQLNRGVNFPMFLGSSYFAFKTYSFLKNVFIAGHGF